MLTKKLNTLLNVGTWLERAEAEFEKRSGWKSREVKSTIQSVTRLNPTSQALFGGLVVGNLLFRREAAAPAPRRTRRATKPAAAEAGAPATA